MIRLSAMLRFFLLAFLLLIAGSAARAQSTPGPPPVPPVPAALSPAQAQQVLDVLRDDKKRAQFIGVLESMAKALPAAPAPASNQTGLPQPVPPVPARAALPPAAAASPPSLTAPASAATTAPPAPAVAGATAAAPAAAGTTAAAPGDLPIPLAPDSLGAEILVGASNRLARLSAEFVVTARTLTDFPLIARWIGHLVHNPEARAQVLAASWRLVVVMAAAVAAERLSVRLLHPAVIRLAGRAPEAAPRRSQSRGEEWVGPSAEGSKRRRRPSALLLLRRLPYLLGRLALDMLPILLLVATGYALLGTPLGARNTARLVILAVLNAYSLTRLVATVTRALLSPDAPRLRLIGFSDDIAAYFTRWVRRIAIIAIFGYATAEVGLLFGLYRVAHDALLKLVSLAVHLCLVVIVLQMRRPVADLIRARRDATGPMAVLRNRLAAVWHVVAIFYIVALWLVWAFDVPDGFARLVRVFVATVVVASVARLLNVWIGAALERALRIRPDLATRYPGLEVRARRYHPIARGILNGVISAAAIVVLFQAWGVDSFAWFASGALGGRVVSALINISITLLGALLAWELANAAVQRHLARLSHEAQAARSARVRTLLPMFRTALLVSICIVAGLIVLNDIGVNIAPLLAGAGVVGLAIGFGSQKLVQDIITGLFLLLENAMQVGDVVSLGGLSGTVENLSIRTIRLRALDGSVHIVPFSAVTTVTNMTRDFGYALLDISVGLNEDPGHVTEVVREVARGLRTEPRWASAIRDDLEVLGLEKFIDLAYVLRVRIQTLPGQRWAVARELNRRIKARFDELAIESPITSHRVLGIDPPLVPPPSPAKPAAEEPAPAH